MLSPPCVGSAKFDVSTFDSVAKWGYIVQNFWVVIQIPTETPIMKPMRKRIAATNTQKLMIVVIIWLKVAGFISIQEFSELVSFVS